jgi:hypothetical protein
MRYWIVLLLLSMCVPVASSLRAQDAPVCPAEGYIETLPAVCDELQSNQVCHVTGTFDLLTRRDGLAFSQPADVISAADLEAVTLTGPYSIARMALTFDMPDEPVTAVIFGAAGLENLSQAGSDFLSLSVSVNDRRGANLRQLPAFDADVVKPLFFGAPLTAVGRTQASDWARVIDAEGASGWVSTGVLRSDENLLLLPVSDTAPAGELPRYAPLQSLRLLDVPAENDCRYVPPGGMLLQTYTPQQNVELIVNDLRINFAGTLYISRGDDRLKLSVLEGQADFDAVYSIEVGEAADVALDGNGLYRRYSGLAEDYDFVDAQNTPHALLPRALELPFSLGGDWLVPFTPGTGYLQSVPADGPCTIAWTVDVNLRTGPGTTYQLRRGVGGNLSAVVDSRAVGTDQQVWWRIAAGIWINGNSTAFAGACAELPFIDPPLND